mgnify:CR=1 FL=1
MDFGRSWFSMKSRSLEIIVILFSQKLLKESYSKVQLTKSYKITPVMSVNRCKKLSVNQKKSLVRSLSKNLN